MVLSPEAKYPTPVCQTPIRPNPRHRPLFGDRGTRISLAFRAAGYRIPNVRRSAAKRGNITAVFEPKISL